MNVNEIVKQVAKIHNTTPEEVYAEMQGYVETRVERGIWQFGWMPFSRSKELLHVFRLFYSGIFLFCY